MPLKIAVLQIIEEWEEMELILCMWMKFPCKRVVAEPVSFVIALCYLSEVCEGLD